LSCESLQGSLRYGLLPHSACDRVINEIASRATLPD
jgi:hypothetical protein